MTAASRLIEIKLEKAATLKMPLRNGANCDMLN